MPSKERASASAEEPPKWAKSKAKAMLKEALLNDVVQDHMKPKEVWMMEEEYQRYKYEKFRNNLNTLRKAHKKGELNKPSKATKWGKSEAKRILREDIISGVVTANMNPKDVYNVHEEYKLYKFENFRTNLKNLGEAIDKNVVRMKQDAFWYKQDRKLLLQLRRDNPPNLPPYPVWHRHRAKKLLKKDIDEGRHLEKDFKPIDLFNDPDREAYREFPLKVFRKHIYQELDERASKECRFAKKKLRQSPTRPKETEEQAAMTLDSALAAGFAGMSL